VASWVYAIEQIWDDPDFEAKHRARALQEASRWNQVELAGRYEQFLDGLTTDIKPPGDGHLPEQTRFTAELTGLPL